MKELPNLLIVDDNPVNLFYLESIIGNLKLNLIHAKSGSEALEKIKGVDLALAIIDIHLPIMDGYELSERINENHLDDTIPIIFINAEEFSEEQVIKAYHVGAVDYILKPLNKFVLFSKIKVFLDLYNQKQTIRNNIEELNIIAEKYAIANQKLQLSERKFRSYIENAPEGVFIYDENGRYLEVNDAASVITGYTKPELLELSMHDLIPEESNAEHTAHSNKLTKTGKSKSEYIFRHKDGTLLWWIVDAVKLNDSRYLCFAREISHRKNIEFELQNSVEKLHSLTQHIEKVREEERLSISRDLHDDLGQALTSVKMDLGIISKNITDEDASLKIKKIYKTIDDTIKTVQRITSELRPQIIDDLGFESAIDWYTGEYSKNNDVQVVLDIDPEVSISPEASLIIFRIMQESLTNISRHANATRVDVNLIKDNNQIEFSICDNGIGITEKQKKAKRAFGIMGMIERANSLGGNLDIFGQKGQGTTIKLTLPIN